MKQAKAVVFDLYGTLYDVHSVAGLCGEYFPGRGLEISIMWRQKQLEYTWLRSLMGKYVSFEQATRDALDFVADRLELQMPEQLRSELCNEYLNLKPYPEVRAALDALRSRGVPLAILSNGSVFSIRSVVENSHLVDRFDHLISVEEVEVFKPHENVYQLAEKRLGLYRSEIMFVSSNAWDAAGARHFGYQVCWVNRIGNTFDRLGESPNHVIESLDRLPDLMMTTATS
ncbi:haloacid dehalogenase type II [Paraburkholderia caribensis]|uniref:haloacid dehalogenase type II n=1 Tax=Paraburkholderia TaxID=1822464 RepID=UPI001CB5038B|nr:haloacid dehalogenase type II [Paraburkholderia caribensis]BEU25580.1 haloacid dehalogenase type II [Paraburkholderia sp. 22B1P]CAG9262609.1 (S)-2-haloacid dehalogenase 2 [Paraburkholderia caribensis]